MRVRSSDVCRSSSARRSDVDRRLSVAAASSMVWTATTLSPTRMASKNAPPAT